MNAPISFPLKPFRISTERGLEFSCVEHGNPAGTPAILLHGYSDSWRSFEPLLAALPHSIHAIAVTQRGHGDSTKPETGYRIGDYVDDLAIVLDRLGIAQAFIVGHSMGSLVAERFAIDHPDRVLGLVLIGAFRTVKDNAGAEALWHDGVATMTDPVDPAFVQAFQASTLAIPLPSAFLETVIRESLKVPAHVWRATLRALLDEDFGPELRRITAPTLILWGDRDGFSERQEQVELEVIIRGSRSVTFPGIGHAPHWEAPQRAAAEIVAFVEAVTTASPQ